MPQMIIWASTLRWKVAILTKCLTEIAPILLLWFYSVTMQRRGVVRLSTRSQSVDSPHGTTIFFIVMGHSGRLSDGECDGARDQPIQATPGEDNGLFIPREEIALVPSSMAQLPRAGPGVADSQVFSSPAPTEDSCPTGARKTLLPSLEILLQPASSRDGSRSRECCHRSGYIRRRGMGEFKWYCWKVLLEGLTTRVNNQQSLD